MRPPADLYQLKAFARANRIWTIFSSRYPDHCEQSGDRFQPSGLLLEGNSDGESAPEWIEARQAFDELREASDNQLIVLELEVRASQSAPPNPLHWLDTPPMLATAQTYDHFAKAACWTLDEGVALLVERNPAHFHPKAIRMVTPTSLNGQEFLLLRDLAERAQDMGQLLGKNLPGFFLAWAKRNRLPVPESLEQAILDHGHQVADWKTLFDQRGEMIAELQATISELMADSHSRPTEKPLGERARTSLLKLVIGMAIKGYAHNPKASRTGTASEIASDLRLIGLTLDEDTIRSYLAEGRELLPD
jgi:hypothetical protein